MLGGGSVLPVLTDWFEIAPVGVAVLALLAAGLYYLLIVGQNRTTHEFDLLMRAAAVYQDLMPTKRALAGAFLLAQLGGGRRKANAAERLAIADILRYFDTVSWRAFCAFKFDIGKCDVNRICAHPWWRRGIQQRHEGVRTVIRAIGLPAYMYYKALEEAGQTSGGIVLEAPLESLTQFKRMVDTVEPYIARITHADLPSELRLAADSRGYFVDFLSRECNARDVRPDAVKPPEVISRRRYFAVFAKHRSRRRGADDASIR
jgi:hypothetical protein